MLDVLLSPCLSYTYFMFKPQRSWKHLVSTFWSFDTLICVPSEALNTDHNRVNLRTKCCLVHFSNFQLVYQPLYGCVGLLRKMKAPNWDIVTSSWLERHFRAASIVLLC